MIPFIDIKRFEPGFLDEWNNKIAEMSANAAFIGGPEIASFEAELAKRNDVKYAVSCANGTDAIQLALRAAGVGRGDKVLLPNSTFWATFESVVNVGADPYTVDVNETDLQMDYDSFVKAAEEIKPKAALIVHLYGWGSARLNDFRRFCSDKNIMLIEDGAQAYGVKYKGESIYKNAFISTVSFYPAKVLGAAGDAGAVFTNDKDMADKIRMLSNHGRTSHYEYGLVGWNSRMDSFQAAFLNICMKHIDKRLESRRSAAEKYAAKLAGKVNVINPPEGYEQNGYCNVILLEPETRTKLIDFLKEKQIGFGIIYPGAMSDQSGAKEFIGGNFGNGRTGHVCNSVLSLPLFAYITDEEIDKVVSAVSEFFS